MIRFSQAFRFPLNNEDDAGNKGLFLLVDDHWPELPELWFSLMEDFHHVFFKDVPITRVC
jgi:hypothetical protein